MRYVLGLLAVLSLAAVAAAEPEKPATPVRCTIKPMANEITLGVPVGIEVTLTNVSDAALSLMDPRSQEAWDNGLNHAMWLPKGGTWAESLPVRPGPEAGAGKSVVLAPRASLRYTVWAYWDYETSYAKRTVAGHFSSVPPGPGSLSVYFNATGSWPQPEAPAWTGFLPSAPVAIGVVRADPTKVVAMTLDIAAKEKGSDVRPLAREALAFLTCRHFGKGPGITDADIAEARKWLEANKGKSRQEWIVDAMRSRDQEDLEMALVLLYLVKDPGLADAITATLDANLWQNADRMLDAFWTNYNTDNPRALDYARKEVRNEQYGRRYQIIELAVKHKVQPIMKEGGEVLVGLIKTETTPDMLIDMIKLSASCKAEGLAAVLEDFDRRQPLDWPLAGVVIQTLSDLEGADYRPHLLQLLQSKDAGFRNTAAFCLGKNGDNHCLDALIAALSDPDSTVRVAACNSLMALWHGATPQQYDKAMESLIRLVERSKPNDELPRWQIVMALTVLNPDVTPPEDAGDNRKVAEAWRAVWREVRKKK